MAILEIIIDFFGMLLKIALLPIEIILRLFGTSLYDD